MSIESEMAVLLSAVRERAKSCELVEISRLVMDSSIDVVEIYRQRLREIMSDFEKSLEEINLITNFRDLEVVEKAVNFAAGVHMEDEHFTAFEELKSKLWPAHVAILKPEVEGKARQCQTISEIEALYHAFNCDVYKKRWIQIAKERISTCENWFSIYTLYCKDVKRRIILREPFICKHPTIDSVQELYYECLRKFSHEKALADGLRCKTLAQAIKQFKHAKESPLYSEKARAIYTKTYQRLAKKVIPFILKRCDTSAKVMGLFGLYILRDDCPRKTRDMCRLKWLQLHIQENF